MTAIGFYYFLTIKIIEKFLKNQFKKLLDNNTDEHL